MGVPRQGRDDFGGTAREGDQDAWWFLAVASLGAVACLFVGLMLASRILRRLGITNPDGPESSRSTSPEPAPLDVSETSGTTAPTIKPTRPIGGHRAR